MLPASKTREEIIPCLYALLQNQYYEKENETMIDLKQYIDRRKK